MRPPSARGASTPIAWSLHKPFPQSPHVATASFSTPDRASSQHLMSADLPSGAIPRVLGIHLRLHPCISPRVRLARVARGSVPRTAPRHPSGNGRASGHAQGSGGSGRRPRARGGAPHRVVDEPRPRRARPRALTRGRTTARQLDVGLQHTAAVTRMRSPRPADSAEYPLLLQVGDQTNGKPRAGGCSGDIGAASSERCGLLL